MGGEGTGGMGAAVATAGGAGTASTAAFWVSLGRVTTTGPGIFSLLGTALWGGAGPGGGPKQWNIFQLFSFPNPKFTLYQILYVIKL